MKSISRRSLIKTGLGLGAAAAYSPVSQAGLFIRTRRSRQKAVIIGSGFGGSVAALRLAEAGIPTMLLERGRHWPYTGENSFPRVNDLLSELEDGVLWSEPGLLKSGSTGMLEFYTSTSIGVGCGACLGGGSFVYGGVLLQPLRENFEAALPGLSYDAMDSIYYPRILSRVSGGPIPDDILNSPNYEAMRTFIDNATAAGMDVVRSEVGFDWDIIREELQGKRVAAASIGEYAFGCNSGAKKTLDRNYLVDAEATGNLDIQTLHNVTHVRQPRGSRNYEVICDVLDDRGFVRSRHIIECEYLFMAAGSLHTTRLLLKAKMLGDIKSLNDGIGEEWGTNGDEMMLRQDLNSSTGVGPQGGPPAIAAFDNINPIKNTSFMHSPVPFNLDRAQVQMGMSIPDKNSRATYNPLTDRINVNWSKRDNDKSHRAILNSMQRMVDVGGGENIDLGITGTWHPLGGAAMGTACDYEGEVYGCPNLFVIDGALLPGSAGCANPSLTVGANAERIMETLVNRIS